MEEMIAYCGLVCTGCPAFIATQNNSEEERQRVVEKWSSEQYPLEAKDINCDGCLSSGGRLLKFCHECEVRACGFERGVENCAHCDDFACSKLEKLYSMIDGTEARERLDNIKRNIS
ncbi:MAG: DUF3795 domain-containing protein [candidate division WOR-3 bacterium]|nr:MAG: DUF3795 domain-containing protein [candidate division WOR-3 bacterium]